ncbi:MAG: SPOR domain-containing protein [Paracoccus sp. (in: a-proteobacteria)]
MRGFWRLLAILICPGVVFAAPEPPPPANFAGMQYIDARGCVFTRAQAGWQGRLDPAGELLCGFPPSLDQRRLDPETSHVLPPVTPLTPPDPAQILADRLAEELRNADMTGEVLPAPPPLPGRRNPLLDEMTAAVAQQASVRSAVGGHVSGDLCARLGYRADPVEDGISDPTGFCLGQRPPTPAPRFSEAGAAPQARVAQRPEATPTARPAHPVAATTRQTSRPTPPAARQRAATDVEMIPASARYVQIGVFRDDASAQAAIRALAEAGLPIAQSRSTAGAGRAIMAGPFPDRRRLIETLNLLRAGGWPGAVAR